MGGGRQLPSRGPRPTHTMPKRAEMLSPQSSPEAKVRLFDRYTLGTMRGRGITGQVFCVRDDAATSAPRIVKAQKFNPDEDDDGTEFVIEVLALTRLRGHPHVAEITESIYQPGYRGAIVMRECRGPPLHVRLQSAPLVAADTARQWARQLFSALQYCHARNVIHRDIKAPNLVLTSINDADAALVVVDFGAAHVFADADDTARGARLTRPVTTAWYRAPEMLLYDMNDECAVRHGPPADVWAGACVLYEIVRAAAGFGASALFPGDADADPYELAQLFVAELGTPSANEWSDGEPFFRGFGTRAPSANPRCALSSALTPAPGTEPLLTCARSVLQRTICWNPAARMTAEQVFAALAN